MTIDTFDRADGSLGANWTTNAGSILIASNEAVGNDAGFSLARYSAVSFTNDQASIITVGAYVPGGSRGQGAAVRISTSGAHSCYRAILVNGTCLLHRVVAGVSTSLGSASGWSSGDELGIEAIGTAIKVYKNGSVVISVTDSTFASGSAGIAFWGNFSNLTISSWEGLDGGMPSPPDDPSGLIAEADPVEEEVINLSWTDNSSDETGFKIERSPDNSTWAQIATVGAGITTYADTLPAYDTTYYYRVRAYNGNGNSGYTSSASARTAPAPSWPTVYWQWGSNATTIKSTSGVIWSDITRYIRRWGYKRGRQRQLQRAEAGTAYIELDNSRRFFDPANTRSPFYASGGGMVPGKPIRCSVVWAGITYELFNGYVESWSSSEEGEPTVTVELVDMLGWLGRGSYDGFSVTVGTGATGVAITDILTTSPISFDVGKINIDTGTVRVQSLGADTRNVLATLAQYVDTETNAVFFVDGTGRFVYHDAYRRSHPTDYIDRVTFHNDDDAIEGGALPFARVDFYRDATDYYNRVVVTPNGLAAQIAEHTANIALHGPRELRKSTMHYSTGDASTQANELLAIYNNIQRSYHDNLVLQAPSHSALWPVILGLAITHPVRVIETLYPYGDTRQIDSIVEGMTVDVDNELLSWTASYNLSPTNTPVYTAAPDPVWDWTQHIQGRGMSFPSSPEVYQLHMRDDLGLLFQWNGTYWLTTEVFNTQFNSFAGGRSSSRTNTGIVVVGYSISYVTGATNNGSNYWTMTLRSVNATSTNATNIASPTSAGVGGNAWGAADANVSIVPTYYGLFDILAAATGSPSALQGWYASVDYRKIGT